MTYIFITEVFLESSMRRKIINFWRQCLLLATIWQFLVSQDINICMFLHMFTHTLYNSSINCFSVHEDVCSSCLVLNICIILFLLYKLNTGDPLMIILRAYLWSPTKRVAGHYTPISPFLSPSFFFSSKSDQDWQWPSLYQFKCKKMIQTEKKTLCYVIKFWLKKTWQFIHLPPCFTQNSKQDITFLHLISKGPCNLGQLSLAPITPLRKDRAGITTCTLAEATPTRLEAEL